MKNAIKKTLQQLKDWNIDFSNSKVFKFALLDVQIETDGKKIRRFLHDAVIDMKAYTKLQNAYKNNDVTAVEKLTDAMFDEYGTDKATANIVIGAIAELVGFVNISETPTTNDTVIAPIVQVPVKPAEPTISDLQEQIVALTKLVSGSQSQPSPIVSPSPTKQKATIAIGSIHKFGKYDWRVLDVQNGQALLISKDVTHVNKPYNVDFSDVTWENCTLRKWLNSDFLSEFSSQEQAQICLSTIPNEDNQWYKTKGGNRTTDRIFLLSLSEVVRYFGDSGQLENQPSGTYWINDQYNNERAAKFNNKQTWWWLRSPGNGSDDAASVSYGGNVSVFGNDVDDSGDRGGVRPALWLNLKS